MGFDLSLGCSLHSLLAVCVIPANAGISADFKKMPAFAGMTVIRIEIELPLRGVLTVKTLETSLVSPVKLGIKDRFDSALCLRQFFQYRHKIGNL